MKINSSVCRVKELKKCVGKKVGPKLHTHIQIIVLMRRRFIFSETEVAATATAATTITSCSYAANQEQSLKNKIDLYY